MFLEILLSVSYNLFTRNKFYTFVCNIIHYTLYFSHNEKFYFVSLFIFYILIFCICRWVLYYYWEVLLQKRLRSLRVHCEVYKDYALRVKYYRFSRYVYIYIKICVILKINEFFILTQYKYYFIYENNILLFFRLHIFIL